MGYNAKVIRLIKAIPREEVLNFESDLELIIKKFPEIRIYAYESREFNFKITYKEDLQLAKILLKHFSKIFNNSLLIFYFGIHPLHF